MGRPPKALISRSATLKVALKIIDEEGLEELSIRRLGRELQVVGISLYHHFKNKDDILVGVCELALSHVRTPEVAQENWRDWLVANVIRFRQALQEHPNLIPVLMRRHPLRIGLKEHNATAGLLAVQGVPTRAIMPMVEALEELALGSASYQSAVDKDEHPEALTSAYPHLYHLSRLPQLSRDRLFEAMARATIEVVVEEAARSDASATDEGLVSKARSRPATPAALDKPPPRRRGKTLAGGE